MSLPVAGPQTDGRVFGTDWSTANVAKLLRSNACRGSWHATAAAGGDRAKVNQHYLRTVSARHLPTGASLIFLRLADGWYASICFADSGGYLPWDEEIGEQWLWALFGEDRHLVVGEAGAGAGPGARQFRLHQRTR
jgi:hypothetical protein